MAEWLEKFLLGLRFMADSKLTTRVSPREAAKLLEEIEKLKAELLAEKLLRQQAERALLREESK